VSRWLAFLLGLAAGAFLGVRWAARRAALITPPSFAPLLLSRLRRLYRDPARVVQLLDPRPEWTILDLGCGNGAFTLELARRVRRVVAVDVQPAMIDALEARVRDAGLGNVQARVAPATQLPLDDGMFDAALMISVLPMLHDRAAALAEVRRTLKPDGVLVVGEEWVEPEYVGERTTIGWVERAGFMLLAREATALSYTLLFTPVIHAPAGASPGICLRRRAARAGEDLVEFLQRCLFERDRQGAQAASELFGRARADDRRSDGLLAQ
jgi:SAM-dependent methyltransferase